MNPVLVTGVGRSGTSAVARVLHERAGVCMGPDEIREPTRANPQGDYEDRTFRELHIQVTKGRIKREAFEEQATALVIDRIRANRTVIAGRVADHDPWGFKDPRACHLMEFYLDFPIDWKVIVCERPFEDVVASWRRVCAGDSKQHRREIRARRRSLEEALADWDGDVLRLDMSTRRSEAWILEKVGAFLGLTVDSSGERA